MLGADETFFKSEAGSSDCFNFIVVLIKSFRKIGFNIVFVHLERVVFTLVSWF